MGVLVYLVAGLSQSYYSPWLLVGKVPSTLLGI